MGLISSSCVSVVWMGVREVGSVEDAGYDGSRVLQTCCSAERVLQPIDCGGRNVHPVFSIKVPY